MFRRAVNLSRKYGQKAASIFLVLYLTLSPLLSFPYEIFAATTDVTPTSLNGWSEYVTSGGSVSFIPSASAPSGYGVLQLTTDPTDNNSRANLWRSESVSLADVQDMSYMTKQNSANWAGGDAAYKLSIDADGNTSTTTDTTTLVYEPYWQNAGSPDADPVVSGVWQTWDVDSGLFWASIPGGNSVPGLVNGAGGPPLYTISDVLGSNPDALIQAVWVGAGSYNPNYDIEIDNYVFNYDSGSGLVSNTYNFEIDIPVPDAPSLLTPADGSVFRTSDLPQSQTWSSVTDAVKYVYESYTEDPDLNPTATPFYTQETTSPSRTIGTTAPEGTYWWRVKSVNMYDSESAWSDVWTFSVDNTKPSIEILSPVVPDEVLTTSVSVRGTDNIQLKTVTGNIYDATTNTLVQGCSQNVSSLNTDDFTLNCNVSALATGTYFVKARSVDMTDNGSSPSTIQRTFIIDKEYPVINATRMYVNGTLSSLAKSGDTVRIEVDVTDLYSPIDKIQVWVREYPWSPNHNQLTSGLLTPVSGDTWEFTYIVPATYEDGAPINETFEGNYFNFRTYDSVGNNNIGWRSNFTIDNTIPDAPTITAPYSDQYFTSTPILDDWTDVTTDASGIMKYRVEYVYDDGHSFPSAPYRETTVSERNHVPNINEQGGVTIRVQAIDNAGNEGAWSAPVHYYYDATAPETPVWLNSPIVTHNGDYTYSDPLRRIDMRFTESTDMMGTNLNTDGVDHYEYSFVRRDLSGNLMGSGTALNMNSYLGGVSCSSGECVWTPDIQPDSQWIYRMRAVDQAGNKSAWSNWDDASDSEFSAFNFSYNEMDSGAGIFSRSDFDDTAGNGSYMIREDSLPSSSITTADSITNSSSVPIDYVSSDIDTEVGNVELWYSYEGAPYTMFTQSTSPSGTFSVNLPDGDGEYCFYTIAEDVANDGILDAGIGNREGVPTNPCELNVLLDTTAPTVGSVGVLFDFLGQYVNGDTGFAVGALVDDNGSGVNPSSCEIALYGTDWAPGSMLLNYCYTTVPSLPDADVLSLNVRISDNAGNGPVSGTAIGRTADSVLPSTTTDIADTYYGPNTFNNPTTTIVGTASDTVSGISDINLSIRRSSDNRYYLGSGIWFPISLTKPSATFSPTTTAGTVDWSYAGGFTKSNGVTYTVQAYAKDNVHVLSSGTGVSDSFIWDSSLPSDPTDFSSSTHTVGAYSNDNYIKVSWPSVGSVGGASDALSGVAGYYYSFSEGVTETPDTIPGNWIDSSVVGIMSSALADGEWYFNIRTMDNVGNITSTQHYGPFYIDTVTPTVTFDLPADSTVTNQINFSGTVTDDYSGVDRIKIKFKDSIGTVIYSCFATYNSLTDTWTADGSNCTVPNGTYAKVVAKAWDIAGNTSKDKILDFTYDTEFPTDPDSAYFISSHVLNTPTSSDTITVDWPDVGDLGGADDTLSGVAGYSYIFSQESDTVPDQTQDLTYDITEVTEGGFPDGDWYFHISTVDNAGNWTSTSHYGPMVVDTTAPVITVLGTDPVTVIQGDTYTDAGASAVDNQDISLTIVTVNPVDTNVLGSYTVTYNVSDSAGNPAAQQSRTVNVVAAPAGPAVLAAETTNTDEDEGTNEEDNGEVLGLQCEEKQTITGYVYVDENNNGKREDSEGIEGVELKLVYVDENGDKTTVDTLITDENGRWRAEVCSGEYTVELDEDTLPDNVKLDGDDVLGIFVGDSHGEHNINFELSKVKSGGFEWWWIPIIFILGGGVIWLFVKIVFPEQRELTPVSGE